jgi:hypothetical protein
VAMVSRSKPAETIPTAGLPAFSIAIRSWTSHDVQEPQSPVEPMNTSHSCLARAMSDFSQGMLPS